MKPAPHRNQCNHDQCNALLLAAVVYRHHNDDPQATPNLNETLDWCHQHLTDDRLAVLRALALQLAVAIVSDATGIPIDQIVARNYDPRTLANLQHNADDTETGQHLHAAALLVRARLEHHPQAIRDVTGGQHVLGHVMTQQEIAHALLHRLATGLLERHAHAEPAAR